MPRCWQAILSFSGVVSSIIGLFVDTDRAVVAVVSGRVCGYSRSVRFAVTRTTPHETGVLGLAPAVISYSTIPKENR